MKVSAAGRDRIASREGKRLKAYEDSTGVWTIGVGHTGRMSPPAVHSGMTITAEQSDEYLAADLAPVEAAVNGLGVVLTQNQFDALASLAFNIGVPGFEGSTVARDLKAGKTATAANAFLMWEKPASLKTRRESERAQFLTPDGAAAPAASAAPKPQAKTMSTSDPIGAFFEDLGSLFSSHFGDALSRILTPTPPQAAPPASASGSTAGPTSTETDYMLKLAELFLSNFSSFASYATVLPHLATEIPDIVAKAEAMVKAGEQLVADIKAGKIGNAPTDFQAVFTAVEGILNDVGINLGTITNTVALMPQLPTVASIQAIPSPGVAKAA